MPKLFLPKSFLGAFVHKTKNSAVLGKGYSPCDCPDAKLVFAEVGEEQVFVVFKRPSDIPLACEEKQVLAL